MYVFDFGDHAGVGFTGEEVAELLESEKFKDGKVYKIHRALPDGHLEIKGVSNKVFQVESGMFFHCRDEKQAREDYDKLSELAGANDFPCRAKVHLSRDKSGGESQYVIALIYPGEYEDEISGWLIRSGYEGGELASGGTSQVEKYYQHYEKVQSCQLWGVLDETARDAEEVLANVGKALVR